VGSKYSAADVKVGADVSDGPFAIMVVKLNSPDGRRPSPARGRFVPYLVDRQRYLQADQKEAALLYQ
jgi:hypothetical protein